MAYILAMHPVNRLRELRKTAGLTQVELAERAGVSQAAISQVENDTRPMTVDWMRTFARILDCTPADLLGEDDNPDRLSEDERRLLALYRDAEVGQREMIHRVAEPMTPFTPEPSGGDRLRAA